MPKSHLLGKPIISNTYKNIDFDVHLKVSQEPNVNDIKKWIENKLESEKSLEESNYKESSTKISDDLSKISESYNLSFTPLRDIISGKGYLRKARKLLQSEVVDWTLSPFLDRQTYFNKKITEILRFLNSKQESTESSLESLNSKQESTESSLESLNSKQESTESSLESLNSKQESTESSLESLNSKQESTESSLESLNSKQESTESSLESLNSKQESTESSLESLNSKQESTESSLESLNSKQESTESSLESLNSKQESTESSLESLNSKQESTESSLESLNSKQESTESSLESLNSKQESTESSLESLNSKQESTESSLESLNSKQESTESSLESLNSKQESTESSLESLNSKQESTESKFSNILKNIELFNSQLSDLKIALNKLRTFSYTTDISIDDLNYGSFEERFRGSYETIKERQKRFLKFIKTANKNTNEGFFIDIGSGRGEFLDLLKEANIPCKGIDIDKRMIELSQKHGHEVTNIDALDFLRSASDNELKGVVSFQVIEHLNPNSMIHLIHQCCRTIKKGGTLILETVNPNSLHSLMSFWNDPTHLHPIPPDVLKFYFEMADFKDVEILYYSDVPETELLEGDNNNTKKLNKLLFGPQDYAVIGWK